MSGSVVCDFAFEDAKYSIDIKEEPLDNVTDIDIKHDSLCALIKDEIDIKGESLESNNEFNSDLKMRSSCPLNPNSSNSKVCSFLVYLLYKLLMNVFLCFSCNY